MNSVYDLYPDFADLVEKTITAECAKAEKTINLQSRLEGTFDYSLYKEQLRYLYDMYDLKFDSSVEQTENDIDEEFYKKRKSRVRLFHTFSVKYMRDVFKSN